MIYHMVIRLRSWRSSRQQEGSDHIKDRYKIFIIICLMIGWLTNPSIEICAQDELTLPYSWQLLRHNNYTLQQQEKLLGKATEEVAIQKTGYLPSFGVGGSYNYVSDLAQLQLESPFPTFQMPAIEAGTKNQYDLSLFIKQPLVTGFRIRNLVQSAHHLQLAQGVQKIMVLNQLLLQVGQVFYNIQLNRLQQEVLTESIQRVENHLTQIRNMLLAEQTTAFDTLEVANRKLMLSNQLSKLQDLQKVLFAQLRFLLNQKDLPPMTKMTPVAAELILQDLAEYQNIARLNRPEVQHLSELTQAHTFQIRAIKSVFYPQVYGNMSYHYARPGVNFFRDEWMDYFTVGVNLQWELWNWHRDRRKVNQMRLELENLDLKHQHLLQDIDRQVEEAYQYLATTRHQIQLQQQLIFQEKERYRITEEKYQQGLATSLDLRTAEHALTEAQLEQQKNYINWYQYRLLIDFTTGTIGND